MKHHQRVILLISIFLNQFLFAQETIHDTIAPSHIPLANYPALLWEISGNGLQRVSYLYGSLETSDKLAYHLTDSFFYAFKQCSSLMLEMHPDSVRKSLQDPQILRRAYKHSFSTRYRPSTGSYYALLQPGRFDDELFEDVLAGHLGWGFGASDMDEEKTLPDFMFMAALKLSKGVKGAMSFTESLDFREINEKVQKESRNKSRNTRTDYQQYRNNVNKAYDAYRRGDIGLLDTLYKQIVDDPEYFIQVKNPMSALIAARIAEQLSGGGHFVVVDVTLMAGSSGIIEHLRAAGYTLRPVRHEVLTRPNKQKEQLERMTTRTKHSAYVSNTGFWSMDVPTQALGSVNERNGNAWFTDHLNDAFYSVTRNTTNAQLNFQSPEYLIERMDSVIYEYVPGKIVRRKDIKVHGYPGLEILNRTSRGHLEQARIIVTPLEVISFRVSGPKSVIKKHKAGKRLLNSAQITHPGSTWSIVSSGHGEYQIELPSYHLVDSITNRVFLSPDITYQAWDPATSSYFMFRRNLHHDLTYLEEDTFDLNYMAEQIAVRMKRELDLSAPGITQGYPSVDFSLTMKEEGKDTLFCKLVLRGAAHYLMLARSGDAGLRERFFNGLTFVPFDYDLNNEPVIDSSLMYTVNSPVSKQEIDRTDDEEDNYYSWMINEEKEDKSYEASTKRATYFYDSGAEYIVVERKKEHDYVSYSHYADLWKFLIEDSRSEDSTLVIHERFEDTLATFPSLEISFRAQGTCREIKKKFIIHHGHIFTLSTMYDTLASQQPYTRQFFETFSPIGDSLPGRSLFEDKGFLFVTNFLATDTNKVKQAISSLKRVKFSAIHGDTLLHIIRNKEIMSRNLDVSKRLISAYAGIKLKNALAELRSLYDVYEGNPGIQMEIFRAIAMQPDPKMPSVLLEIMSKDLPLPASISDIMALRRPLIKQKDAAVQLFPDFVQYLRYPEYTRLIIELLSELTESGSYQPAEKSKKPVMLALEQQLDREMRLRRIANQSDPADKNPESRQHFVSMSESWWDDDDDEEVAIEIEAEMAEDESMDMDELMEMMELLEAATMDTAEETRKSRPGIYVPDVIHLIRVLDHLKGETSWRKQITANLLNGKNRNEAIAMSLYLTEKGEPVPDSVLSKLSADPKTRTIFYRELHRIKATHLFDTAYLTPQLFAESFYTIKERVTPEDSLTYLSARPISTPLKSGSVHFFKVRSGYGSSKKWYIAMVAVMPDSTQMLHQRPEMITETSEQIFENDDLEELIENQMKKMRKLHRKRFADYDDFDEDYEMYLEDFDF